MGMGSSVVGLKLMIITCLVLVCMVASAPKAAAKALDFSSCVSIKTFIIPCFDYFIEGLCGQSLLHSGQGALQLPIHIYVATGLFILV